MSKKLYLEKIEELGINPNFFISETYFNQSSIEVKWKNGWLWLEEDGLPLFPAVSVENPVLFKTNPVNRYWASFVNPVTNGLETFLDYQYIYNPHNFCDLRGGNWETFRKNTNKFKAKYNPTYTSDIEFLPGLWNLIDYWFTKHADDLEDAEFILDCISVPKINDYIRYLYDDRGEMIALNYADQNWKYVNYRFVICKDIPGLDEYARLMFYTDPSILNKNKMVNDGGTLGREGLKRFKDKLHPLRIEKIYSLTT